MSLRKRKRKRKMSNIIETLVHVLGSLTVVTVLLMTIVVLIKLIFALFRRIKKVDYAWCIVISAKRRHETAEDVLDDIIGICESRSGIRWKGLTDKQRKDVKRVLERIYRKDIGSY